MKRLLSLFLLVVFYTLHAQTGEKIAYYYQGKKLAFPTNNARVVVRFTAGETMEKRRGQMSSILHLPDTAIKMLANRQLALVDLSANITPLKIKTTLTQLNRQGLTDFVHPCFKSAYGKDIGYG